MQAIDRFDVIVVGGGPAGVCAAVQAARAGARTLLVEKSGVLGGTTVLAGVNLPGLFHAWGRQVIAGIGWSLVRRAVADAGGRLPDFSNFHVPHNWLQIPVDKAIYAALCDDAVIESGATLLLHSMPAAIERAGQSWHLTVCCKEGLQRYEANVVIDCTGDANVIGLAGLPLERNENLQPATLMLRVGGYDLKQVDLPRVQEAFEQGVQRGEMLRSDLQHDQDAVGRFLSQHGQNCMHVPGVDGTTSAGKTRVEVLARQAMMRVYHFFRTQPGLEKFRIEWFAVECGIRETRTIRGRTCITASNYTTGRVWDDSVCYSFYPIDLHRTDGHGIDIRPLREGVVPTIPRGAMLPTGNHDSDETANLLVAGRCISGDQLAHSAYRVQATCMATGQAAGAIAALACLLGVDVGDVPMQEVRTLLRRHDAIVP